MATMLRIMADHDVEGHVGVLIGIWTTPEWLDIWRPLGCGVESLASLGLRRSLPDSQVWEYCQENGIVLVTGNRNKEGDDSLEATMLKRNTPHRCRS